MNKTHATRLELLDEKDRVLSTFAVKDGITLLGRSPAAHVRVPGEGVGGIHVAIRLGRDKGPVVMDLGGPTKLRVNGKETIEEEIGGEQALLEIGTGRLRLRRTDPRLDLRKQPWKPVSDDPEKGPLVLRVRLYVRGAPVEVLNSRTEIRLPSRLGLPSDAKFAWIQGSSGNASSKMKGFAQIPRAWVGLGGRAEGAGPGKLEDWASPVLLEANQISRIFAGPYVAEILLSRGARAIAAAKADPFPRELRKPLAASLGSILLVFALWMLLFGTPQAEVEEPYPVYARIQNIPIEKIPDPEPDGSPQAGGGAGSESRDTTAPLAGAAASAPSKLALSITGGLKSLVGSVLSQAKVSSAVIAESGVGQAAPAVSTRTSGTLAAVGAGATGVAGAAKLGKLAIAGSGKGFSGGSGAGLGTGSGNGIGTGVGDGIGKGSFRIIEEESFVEGGLDKDVIAAVIRNNLAQIKYCYERQLVAEPDLFGKVVARWNINAAGRVEGALVKQTTLSSAPVEQCILTKISGWKFPEPKNGTKVTVTYPFLLKSTR